MRRLVLRSAVAFTAMDVVLAAMAAGQVLLGFRTGDEFGGATGTALFVAVVAIGVVAGALSVILLAAIMCRRWGWAPTRSGAILAGAALSVPAFLIVATAVWLIDGAQVPLGSRFREPRALPLIPVFALGGAIVFSALIRSEDPKPQDSSPESEENWWAAVGSNHRPSG